mmetsp:Transcript_15771/g.36172  ORF Transcript_15771/g.36172 Transcript_15771/m.36172 type:complete len:369 (+) Transcript_15771:96-1202(+)
MMTMIRTRNQEPSQIKKLLPSPSPDKVEKKCSQKIRNIQANEPSHPRPPLSNKSLNSRRVMTPMTLCFLDSKTTTTTLRRKSQSCSEPATLLIAVPASKMTPRKQFLMNWHYSCWVKKRKADPTTDHPLLVRPRRNSRVCHHPAERKFRSNCQNEVEAKMKRGTWKRRNDATRRSCVRNEGGPRERKRSKGVCPKRTRRGRKTKQPPARRRATKKLQPVPTCPTRPMCPTLAGSTRSAIVLCWTMVDPATRKQTMPKRTKSSPSSFENMLETPTSSMTEAAHNHLAFQTKLTIAQWMVCRRWVCKSRHPTKQPQLRIPTVRILPIVSIIRIFVSIMSSMQLFRFWNWPGNQHTIPLPKTASFCWNSST